jgi:CheY-like chemotaxis protein
MENNAKILLCDENGAERRKIIDFLSKAGLHNIDEATNGESAIEKLSCGGYSVAIVDLWLSGVDGIGIIRNILSSNLKSKPSFILLFLRCSARAAPTASVSSGEEGAIVTGSFSIVITSPKGLLPILAH